MAPQYMRLSAVLLALLFLLPPSTRDLAAQTTARPNILWISCEDTSPHLGCYGDPQARTPRIDALARESIRYTNAFAYTGVCAPSRSCLITGVYPLRLGSQHMRSSVKRPEIVRCFPEYLREAGWYCSNNSKQDYNFKTPEGVWDDSSSKAHWRNREPGQPFFSVFNFTVCHQSQIFASEKKYRQNTKRLTPEQIHDPAAVVVPPIHPDTPEFREEWARHYDNVTAMDYQVGDILDQLRDDGLTEETIIFFFSDHGTGMPAIKMFAWDASLRVPLLVRIPRTWQQFSPGKAGETCERLVSFVDFAPTILSLCGLAPPEHMQGSSFLGEFAASPRSFVYGGKDRQGETYDTIRYVHDGRFHYLRNFQPQLPWGQYMSYTQNHDSLRSWEARYAAGDVTPAQRRFFEPKPREELYNVSVDPWEIHNLADDPSYQNKLNELRNECRRWMLDVGDVGLLPEREIHARAEAAGSTPYEMALDPQWNPLAQLLDAAWIANAPLPSDVPTLNKLLQSDDSAVRYWGALGLLTLGEHSSTPTKEALLSALQDSSPDVRVVAAEAFFHLGEKQAAQAALEAALQDDAPPVRLAALGVIQRLGPPAKPLLPAIAKASIQDPEYKDVCDYIDRMVNYLPARLNEK